MNVLSRVRISDIVVVCVLIFFGIAGAIPGIAPNQASEMTGAAGSTLQSVVGIGSQLLIYGAIVAWMTRDRAFWAKLRVPSNYPVLAWPMLLASWAVVSTMWSVETMLTMRRAIPFALAALFGVFLAVRYEERRFLGLLQIAFVLLALWSALLACSFPAIGLDASTGHRGDWQGAFSQKNACGRMMVFALASAFCAGRLNRIRMLAVALFGAEVFLSGSRGAWLLAALALLAVAVLAVSSRLNRALRTALFLLVGLSAIALTVLGIVSFAMLAPLLGRDATLTGRTAIWHQVWLSILHRPLLGYGFSAFWHGMQPPSWQVVIALRFVLFHAHNGFLEIWLELGLTGLLVFVIGFMRALWLLWPHLASGRYGEAAWPFMVLFLIALYDIDENTLLAFNGLFWLLYVTVLARIEMLALERRSAGRLGLPALCFENPGHTPFLLASDGIASARTPWV